ncbi:MAG: ribonuclease Y [Pseudomonadota bacterium]
MLCVGCSSAAFFLGRWFKTRASKKNILDAQRESDRILEEARETAKSLIRDAELQIKDESLKVKAEFEKESKEIRNELKGQEKRLAQKSEAMDRKMDAFEQREAGIANREREVGRNEIKLQNKIKHYESLVETEKANLEKVANCSAEEAKQMLIHAMEGEARIEAAKLIKRIDIEAREISDKKSKDIIAMAIQRYAGDYVAERTVSVVPLPNEEMKGRIIGREGRNIRAIEAATGIDLIIDDTPEAVVLSGFNPVRREVARLSLERLIADGRIHPGRIEDVVRDVAKELDVTIRQTGEEAAFDLGVHELHSELIQQLGKLKFRTSYAQNVLQHSIEVGFLTGIMASELGLDVKQARRAGLLHDIGKAVDHEVEGSHAAIGARLAKKYGESPEIIHAIEAHHEEIPAGSVLAILTQAADALSGARPGARREMLETYVKRLEDLENVAKSFSGVQKSYAVQAGRDLRVMVESGRITDEDAILLSRDIAKKIEETMTYPGQIKVTVIRETRAVEYAK